MQVIGWHVSIAAQVAWKQVKNPSQVDEPWHDGLPIMVGLPQSGPLAAYVGGGGQVTAPWQVCEPWQVSQPTQVSASQVSVLTHVG